MTAETSWWVRHVLHPRCLHANYLPGPNQVSVFDF